LHLISHRNQANSTSTDKDQKRLGSICQWLWRSTPDPSSNHGSALQLHLKDTGLWFLESQQFARWKAEPMSYLWLHGIPGCGKTILSSLIIEQLILHVGNDPCQAVAYFYFDFKTLTTADLMLKSILAQLAQRCVKPPKGLDSLYSTCGDGLQTPSLQLLKTTLRETISEFVDVYIVLDALDESEKRPQLMETLREISEWQEGSLHILLTSRKERDIEDTLELLIDRHFIISLRTGVVDNDIRIYVQYRLSVEKNLRKWYNDQAMREEISSALMKRSKGM
jgi:Cdc6-like AAA superfamily ATPase